MGECFGANDQHKQVRDDMKEDKPKQVGIMVVYRTTDGNSFDAEVVAKKHQLMLDTTKKLQRACNTDYSTWEIVCNVAPQVVTILQDFIEERNKL